MKNFFIVFSLMAVIANNIYLLASHSNLSQMYLDVKSKHEASVEEPVEGFASLDNIKDIKFISNIENITIDQNDITIKVKIDKEVDLDQIKKELSDRLSNSPYKINIYDDKYLNIQYRE